MMLSIRRQFVANLPICRQFVANLPAIRCQFVNPPAIRCQFVNPPADLRTEYNPVKLFPASSINRIKFHFCAI